MKQLSTKNHFIVLLLLPVVVLVAFASAVAIAYVATSEQEPYASELAFVETSEDGSVVGSVVPASCESAPPTNHFVGDCAVPPVPASLNVACGTPVNPPGPKTISWPAAARATYYMIRLDYAGSPAPYLIENNNYTGTSFQFTPTLGTSYSTWVHACNISGCSGPRLTTFTCPYPVVVDVTASPTQVDAGNPVTLTWNVSGASLCTASGGWSGSRSTSGGSVVVNPTANTTYTLSCSGPGGTTADSQTVTVPTGFIAASDCTIPVGGTSCNITVNWGSFNFFGSSQVLQNGVEFSTAPSNGGTVRAVTPDDGTFMLRDTGGSFVTTDAGLATCAADSVWAGGTCVPLPVIDIEANPDVVRSGTTAPIDIDILANYELTCTLSGGVDTTFTHTGAPTTSSYSFTTRPLTSAQIVGVECVSPTYPQVNGDGEVRVEVIPTIQEI